jgi:ribosomal protein L11 methyltransferase
MREIAIRVPAAAVEPVLDELLPLAPHGVFDVDHGDEVELRVRGRECEVPSPGAVAAAAGPWLRWSGVREVPDDWREQRRLDCGPVLVTETLSIRTQWMPPASGGLVDIVLDDRHAAFGSGMHPTTRACLEALAKLPPRGSFADLGCGCGVLTIAAAKLGFGPLAARDFDADAVSATRANAEANGVAADVRQEDLMGTPPPVADVVAANVPLDLHLRLADGIAARPPATLIAAGMRGDDVGAVAAAYARSAALEVLDMRGTTEWPLLVLGPHAS